MNMNKYIFIFILLLCIILLFVSLYLSKNLKNQEHFFDYKGQFNKQNIINTISKLQGTNNPVESILKMNNPIFTEEENNSPKKKKKNNSDHYKSISEGSCRYISSLKSEPSCPAGFESYTGASIGIRDGQLNCSGDVIGNDSAEAMAVLEDKSISKIFITNSGSNYKSTPSVSIIGNGKLATAEAEIEDGKVVSIKITNPGRDYTRPPKIVFSKPDGFVYCHLCCKK